MTATGARIAGAFQRAAEENRAALVPYLTAGDPTPGHTARLVLALERGGADVIELGVPFSDPIADGPVIQRGAERALKAGTSVAKVLEIAREIRKTSEVPLLLFTYLNPVMRYGLEALARDAAAAGIDGCLLTDVSVEEAETYVAAMRSKGLDTVFLAAPTSTARRRELVAKFSTGFVYLVSRTGVTGEQSSVSTEVGSLVAEMRKVSKLPLAVGFGISNAAQTAEVARFADGVVVGSAIVRLIEREGAARDLNEKLEAFTRELASGLKK
ncbi:MAG: tryptophan synthase subunit alpha [Bryobacteraceae bacterium]